MGRRRDSKSWPRGEERRGEERGGEGKGGEGSIHACILLLIQNIWQGPHLPLSLRLSHLSPRSLLVQPPYQTSFTPFAVDLPFNLHFASPLLLFLAPPAKQKKAPSLSSREKPPAFLDPLAGQLRWPLFRLSSRLKGPVAIDYQKTVCVCMKLVKVNFSNCSP